MGLEYAIDELYATGWSALDSSGCEFHADGRQFPSVARVKREFVDAGMDLAVRHIQLFGCHRAEWSDSAGQAIGAVVGQSEPEAAVYALSQLRRQRQPSVV